MSANFAILNGKLQGNLDANNFAITNLSGGLSGSGFLAISQNLGDVGLVPATMRTNIGLPATASGQAVLNLAGPVSLSFLRATGNTPVWRTAAQTLSDVGAQAAHANLTALSVIATPTTLGKNVLVSTNSTGGTAYFSVTSSGVVSLVSSSSLSTGILNGLTINASTGNVRFDGTIQMDDFDSKGSTVAIGGDFITDTAFSVISGASRPAILRVTADTDVTLPPSGTLATVGNTETLTGKTITAPLISGGTHTGITNLGIRATGGGFDLQLKDTETLTAGRYLDIKVADASRTLQIYGNVSFSSSFTVSNGLFPMTLTGPSASTNVTLPNTGTLATLTGSETLSNKILTNITSIAGLSSALRIEGPTNGSSPLIIDCNNYGKIAFETDLVIGRELPDGIFGNDIWYYLQYVYDGQHYADPISAIPAGYRTWHARRDGQHSSAIWSAWTGSTILELHKSNGTTDSCTPAVNGDLLGTIGFSGNTVTGAAQTTRGFGAKIITTATETYASSTHGATFKIQTVLTGASALADRLVIDGLGSVNIKNGFVLTTDALSGAGAVSAATTTTKLTSTGGSQAITLADGTDGQIKTVIHDVDGGSSILTPATKTGYTTITFTNVGETAMLQFVTTRGWMILSLRGAVAA